MNKVKIEECMDCRECINGNYHNCRKPVVDLEEVAHKLNEVIEYINERKNT